MNDREEEAPRSRGRTAASRRSSRATASRSRASSRDRDLSRVLSGNHLDDHSHYIHHSQEERALTDDESTDGAELDERDSEDAKVDLEAVEEAGHDGETIQSIIKDEEAGLRLQKSKSTRSVRDPNLVTWEGPDDPQNPKNWSRKRRWAATLIGKCHPQIFLLIFFLTCCSVIIYLHISRIIINGCSSTYGYC